ncbi:tyrosine-type recombinase/integrase [Escherichia marmotae]|uniref:tyrosine-type recombinase/integrase n=1 Tax=Escherichia marmotae TaxID=1499973 RepID=UPI003CE76179
MTSLPRELTQISRSARCDAAVTSSPALFDWSDALALRRAAQVAALDILPYLLTGGQATADHIEVLTRRLLFDTILNTGARINEALALTPADFYLDDDRPFVVLRTLKQRNRGKGRPRKGEPLKRAVPLSDAAYLQRLREYLATFRPARHAPLWDITDDTARNWLSAAVVLAQRDGVTFSVRPVTPKTLRHSYAMHLIQHRVPLKVVQAFLGHRELSSTEVYTRVFALDVGRQFDVQFTV